MKPRTVKVVSLVILTVILIIGYEADVETYRGEGVPATSVDSTRLSFSPGFNGVTYSSTGSPRTVSEYLYGSRSATTHTILGAGTSTLSVDIPGGWNPTDLSARLYNLYANRSYTRNSNFSRGSAGYPHYWTNKTSTPVKSGWENTTTAHDVYIYINGTQALSTSDFGRWNQTVHINSTNLNQAKLMFRIKRYGTITNYANIFAYVFVNQTQVFRMQYGSLNATYDRRSIDLTSNIPNRPTVVNLTLKMGFEGGGLPNPNGNGYIYFDDVNLYVNGTVVPKSVDLKLNGASVLGQQYGKGTAHLQGALSVPFAFTSNLTSGSVSFLCNSTVKITKVSSSGTVSYNVTQGSFAYYNITKSSNFTSASWTYLSTAYAVDVLNISLPIDWVYDRLIRPDGLVETNSSGQVRKLNNNSQGWMVMVNVTAIGSFGPSPYLVAAHAPNYLVSINTYRSRGGGWTASNLFTNGTRIMINATVQGGAASQGSASVIFYNTSSYVVWRDMSPYSRTPGSNGIASFNFAWTNSNVTTSDLVTVVLWSNSSEVGANWIPITFDLTPPKVGITLPSQNQLVGGTVNIGVSSVDTHPFNLTLSINGTQVGTWSSTSAPYAWDTLVYQDGTVPLTVTAWDQVDHKNATTWQAIIDNTPPAMTVSIPANYSYVHQVVQLGASFSDAHPRNVTIYVDGSWRSASASGSTAYSWNTTTHLDGLAELSVISWDQVGNSRKTTSFVYVDNTPPSIPALVYPNNGEEFNSTTLGRPISWSAASDAGSGVDYYILQLDDSPSFNSARTIYPVNGTSYSIVTSSPLSNGTWYWRVSAVDAVGNLGSSSQPRSFRVIVKSTPLAEGFPVSILLVLGGIPAIAILSSVVLLRKRKLSAESAEYNANDLIAAYVFSSDGRAMFSHAFKETKVDSQLLSGLLTAVSEVMKEVVGGDRRPLSTIERSDAKVLVEFGSVVTGALVAKKASREYRRRLRAFLARFEDEYGERLAKWDGNESVFQAAPEMIEEIFCKSAKITTYPIISGLEDLLAPGKLSGVAVSVAGKTGSGKTEFCLRYAASLLRRGNTVIALAASIPPKEIKEQLKNNGVDVEKAVGEGTLIIYDAYSGVSGLKSDEKYKFGSPGELNNINLALSRNLGKVKKATIFFDSLSTMIDYSDLELAVDFVRTVKVKIQQGGHVAFFIVDSNAHDEKTLNYILHVMDGEIETLTETKKKGELERLVSFKRLKGFQVRPGYHELK